MKFLADQDMYGRTVRYVRSLGHDIITTYEIGLSEAADIDLLRKAKEQNRIFIHVIGILVDLFSLKNQEVELFTFECCLPLRMLYMKN